jgi:MMP 1-O-methyltransferase
VRLPSGGLSANPDVRRTGLNPLLHHMMWERRKAASRLRGLRSSRLRAESVRESLLEGAQSPRIVSFRSRGSVGCPCEAKRRADHQSGRKAIPRSCMNSLKRSLRESYPNAWRWISLSRRIPGWLTDGEANSLFEIARSRTDQLDPVIVELGSWQGKSSVLLAAGVCGTRNARVFCVDPFGADENPQYQADFYGPLAAKMSHSLEQGFERNIRRCGLAHIVHVLKGYSYEVVRNWKDPIDVLFVDASHDYGRVHRDFSLWSPFVKLGGIVALHDVSPLWPGPSRVMAEQLQPPEYGDLRQVNSLAWAVKRSVKQSSGPVEPPRTLITIPYIDYQARLREIERLTNAVSVIETERSRLLDQLNASEQEARLAQLDHDLAESRHAVESLRLSWSWRLTTPIRALADAVRSVSNAFRLSGRTSERR